MMHRLGIIFRVRGIRADMIFGEEDVSEEGRGVFLDCLQSGLSQSDVNHNRQCECLP